MAQRISAEICLVLRLRGRPNISWSHGPLGEPRKWSIELHWLAEELLCCVQFGRSGSTWPSESRPRFAWCQGSEVGRTSVEVMDHWVSWGSGLQELHWSAEELLCCVQFGRSSGCTALDSKMHIQLSFLSRLDSSYLYGYSLNYMLLPRQVRGEKETWRKKKNLQLSHTRWLFHLALE